MNDNLLELLTRHVSAQCPYLLLPYSEQPFCYVFTLVISDEKFVRIQFDKHDLSYALYMMEHNYSEDIAWQFIDTTLQRVIQYLRGLGVL